jgi:transcriptional regulator with XRE-family HTH domain
MALFSPQNPQFVDISHHGEILSKFAHTRQAVFAHLHEANRQNAAMEKEDESPRAILGKNVKALMAHRKMNQTKVGAIAKVDQSTVGRIKKGKNAPDLDTLAGLAKALDVAIWQLLVPNLDPKNLPALQPTTPQEKALYDRLRQAAEILTDRNPQ